MFQQIPLLLLLCFHFAPAAYATGEIVDALPKIVGGQDADPTRYPFYTYLTMGDELCSGTLIWEDIILTAAHCYRPIDMVTAFVNRTSRDSTGFEYERSVVDFRQHPDYVAPGLVSVTEQNDILILKLSSPVPEVERIRLNMNPQQPSEDTVLTVMGFGLLSEENPALPTNLQDVKVNKVSFDNCNDADSFNGEIIDAQMICAAAPGKDACFGDSGGPLVQSDGGQDFQVGLISFGEGCAEANFPGGYMRISHYAKWIESQVCELSSDPPTSCTTDESGPSTPAPVTTKPVSPAPVTPKPVPDSPAPATSKPVVTQTGPTPVMTPSLVTLKPVVTPTTLAPVTPVHTPMMTPSPVTLKPVVTPTTLAPVTPVPTPMMTPSPVTLKPVVTATTPVPVTQVPTNPIPVNPSPTPTPFLTPQCEDCFCVAELEECPTAESGIHQLFDASVIIIYNSFILSTDFIPLQADGGGDCYPFADAVGTLVEYPQSNAPQCQRASENGVCAFVFENSSCNGRTYSMQTFASEVAVASAENAVITHQGACGVCSSAQDLATRMKTLESFETELEGCRTRYEDPVRTFGNLVSCFEELGFTSGCATLWSHTVATEIEVCEARCINIGPPFNNPVDCSLNTCLQCITDKYGTDLERVAGRTMPRSGIVERVARPCDQFYAVPHDPCPAFEAPGEPPDGGGGSGFCFSGQTVIQVKDSRGVIFMKDLKLGDKILVNEAGKFEPVYSFGHRLGSGKVEYLQLHPSMLELSKDHLVFVETKGIIPAGLVEIGDMLKGTDVPVKHIQQVQRVGMFAPFTPSGTLMVNGVQASSYVAFEDSAFLKIGSMSTPLSFQWVAHTFQTPHRLWCRHLGKCLTEKYTEQGVSEWVAAPHEMALWLMVQHPIILTVLLIPFVLFMCLFVLIDSTLLYPAECCLFMTTVAMLLRIKGKGVKKLEHLY